MIRIGYIFKPKTRQADDVAEVVRQIQTRGYQELTISRFYELAVERALEEYRHNSDTWLTWLGAHADSARTGRE